MFLIVVKISGIIDASVRGHVINHGGGGGFMAVKFDKKIEIHLYYSSVEPELIKKKVEKRYSQKSGFLLVVIVQARANRRSPTVCNFFIR